MLLAASRQRDVQEVVLVKACSVHKYTGSRGHCAFRNTSTVGHQTVMGLGVHGHLDSLHLGLSGVSRGFLLSLPLSLGTLLCDALLPPLRGVITDVGGSHQPRQLGLA